LVLIRLEIPKAITLNTWQRIKALYWALIVLFVLVLISLLNFGDSKLSDAAASLATIFAPAHVLIGATMWILAERQRRAEHSRGYSTAPLDPSLPREFLREFLLVCPKSGIVLCRGDQIDPNNPWRDFNALVQIARQMEPGVELQTITFGDLRMAAAGSVATAKKNREALSPNHRDDLYAGLTRLDSVSARA
jgi:hypothetical protein